MSYKNKEQRKEYNKKWYQEHKKEKNQCSKQWYQKHKEEKKQWRQEHKKEKNQYNKQYNQEHKEEKKQYNKQWRQDHREQTKQYNKQWHQDHPEYSEQYYQDNKEKINQYNKQYNQNHPEYNKQWSKNRYQIDIMYRLNRIIRSAIKQSLKKNSLSKNHRPWETLVGFTIQELKLHLEKQFDSNMNWNNHGTYWHLDHIIPLSSLKFSSVNDENFKFLWCLTNLQPLFGPENISKSNKFIINLYSLLFPFVKI